MCGIFAYCSFLQEKVSLVLHSDTMKNGIERRTMCRVDGLVRVVRVCAIFKITAGAGGPLLREYYVLSFQIGVDWSPACPQRVFEDGTMFWGRNLMTSRYSEATLPVVQARRMLIDWIWCLLCNNLLTYP